MLSSPATRHRENGRFTYGDYLRLQDDRRAELIGGMFYDMSPSPSTEHQRVSMELAARIHGFLSGRDCEVFTAPFDVRLPAADEADEEIVNVVQPDILVVCNPEKLDERGCRGAPDWIIEIISPATASRDYIEKYELYQQAGVREYWLVHPDYRIVNVHLLGPDHRYGPQKSCSEKDTVEPATLPGLMIDLGKVFVRHRATENSHDSAHDSD